MMNETALLQNYLLVGAVLFALGLTGFLVRRNLVVMFLAAEMMLQGISLSLTAWGRFHGDWGGQLLVVLIITVAACEAGIALAVVLMLCRDVGNLDIAAWQSIREDGTRPFVDRELPEDRTKEPHWPILTPSGHEPASQPQDEWYRSHV
jgi:NADH-quinone oxidoreductase subunit K